MHAHATGEENRAAERTGEEGVRTVAAAYREAPGDQGTRQAGCARTDG